MPRVESESLDFCCVPYLQVVQIVGMRGCFHGMQVARVYNILTNRLIISFT